MVPPDFLCSSKASKKLARSSSGTSSLSYSSEFLRDSASVMFLGGALSII